MTKPKVTTNPVANQYTDSRERIIEYSHKGLGGLIALREMPDGTLLVQLYRHDDKVQITVADRQPRVEIVHGRDPDSSCEITVYVDGKPATDVTEEDIDPGRGWERSDWDERVEAARNDENYSPAFKAALLETLDAYSDSKYIDED